MSENPFTWVYFPVALGLGALHALEPGHAKTLTAAYLIGIKGTLRDALFLGLAVASTHSVVVIGISVLALWLGEQTFATHATHWLQVGSGVAVILLGSWMLIRRLRQQHQLAHHHHEPHDHDDHSHLSEDAHTHAHAATLPSYVQRGERPTFSQIIAFGAAGGMIPCPASITVMLLALSIGKVAAGLWVVLGFSIGLAATLVGIGTIVVIGIRQMRPASGLTHWFSHQAPVISAAVVILSGLLALIFVQH